MSFDLVRRLRNLVKPSNNLPKKRDNKVRVIIEGSDYDDWKNFHFDTAAYEIPQDITCVRIGERYSLDLIARINPEGALRPEFLPDQTKQLDLEYCILTGEITRPTTLITEDGRVFHDKGLLEPNDANNQRLNQLLTYLAQKYSRGGFEKTYKQLTSGSS